MTATAKDKTPVSANGDAPHTPQRIIDLVAARTARREAMGEPVILKWDEGIDFTLPVELPAEFALCAQEGDMRGAISALLGDQASEFFALRPSMDDVQELAEQAGRVYGIKPGESLASAKS